MKLLEMILDNLSNYLINNNEMIAVAESCTGGLVAKLITDRAGSSAWFERGFVTYSNASKMEVLGVDVVNIEQHGAVSESVVAQMARGAVSHSQASYAVAVSGIAGPDGASDEKPVGTVCFAWAGDNGLCHTVTQQYSGSREQVRQQAAVYALEGLLSFVDESHHQHV